MKRTIIYLIGLSLVFWLGYFFGSQRSEQFKRNMEFIKKEGQKRFTELEKDSKKIRLKMLLSEAKYRLSQSEADIRSKNFGSALTQIKTAEEEIARATELADDDLERTLKVYAQDLSKIRAEVEALNPGAGTKIERLRKELEKVTSPP